MLTAKKTFEYTDDEFDEMLDKDLDAGENPKGLTTAPGNILTDTTDDLEKVYIGYLNSIMDADYVEDISVENDTVVNPKGILYVTANSASGSKFYDLVPREQTYIASRWQGDAPTYSVVEVDGNTFKLDTYRTDTDDKIDTFTIRKKVPAKGSAVKDSKSGVTYKVTKSGAASGTVQFAKVSDKKAKSVTVPSTVKVDGISYKVTSVDANAFSGCKNLQKVVLGANITKVSANTFSKCSGLNTIVIKSTKLTSENLSKRAFKGISSKTVIKVPKNKVKTYQKLFVKKGLSKKVKIKAI
ncbi:MAG: leucine-rich repeat domain-containing protein [Lachnospiraceae bacterium]|nr:leucine-rich repeat domain-containing protein [Lachnospiraceae bacterium]